MNSNNDDMKEEHESKKIKEKESDVIACHSLYKYIETEI